VRKSAGKVRIAAQLIDALSGTHLWADRFDGSLEDVLDLQDKVAYSAAGVIEPALQAAEMRRSATRPTTDLSAYDLYLRALAIIFPITKERVRGALGLLEQAIAIDRHYGPALSWAAICHLRLEFDGWTEAPEAARRTAIDLARRALEAGENDPTVLANAAQVLAGQPDLAIEHIETSLRLSPRERVGSSLSMMGIAFFFKRQFDEAAARLLLSIQDDPGFPPSYRFLAACYAHMGRLDEARAIVAKLRAITRVIVPGDLRQRNPEYRELLVSGLRLAAGEET